MTAGMIDRTRTVYATPGTADGGTLACVGVAEFDADCVGFVAIDC